MRLGRAMSLLVWSLIAQIVVAQTPLPPPAAYYELGIFRSQVSMTTPFTVTRVNLDQVSCGRWKQEPAPDAAPNPTTFAWDDPADAMTECRVSAPAVVLSLPLGTQYRAALRSVAADQTASPWTFAPLSFRRAPRGLPCPNGQPGVLVSGEADLNGAPVQISICVNR